GWARDHDWNGRPFVHVGLFLDRAFRGAGAHEPLSRPLLDLAAELGRRSGIEQALMFYRSVDTAHPRIARALGFRDLPVSMIGFRHNLDCLPDVRLPAGVEARPARLPEDRDVLRLLSGRAFDDPATQGQPMTTSHVDVIAGHPEYLPESITIAWHGTDPVGYLVSCPADVAGSNCSDLAELGVIPEWRGRRVGAGLLCQHLRWARVRGLGGAVTAAFSTNPTTALYWRMGFRPDAARTYSYFTRPLAS
ncbi:GNAT family N-acetyltransferase, partial [candidate division WOR-3 bacterium]|nr:GNAT family N-acetyltransferase [candidate division WOR-3 bacterium]